MSEAHQEKAEYFDRERLAEEMVNVYATISRLRAPDGCPWDREQTPSTLRASVLEEAHEVIDAINRGELAEVVEELGDLLLLVLMIARIYEEQKDFEIHTVPQLLNDKLIRRHPHVFGDSVAQDADAVVDQWNKIKVELEGKRPKDSVMDGVSESLPPLARALKLQKRAARVGFDWENSNGVRQKVHEEIDEFFDSLEIDKQSVRMNNSTSSENIEQHESAEAEFGDVLFSLVNFARWHKIDPTLALARTNQKFSSRFKHVEQRMRDRGEELSDKNLSTMEAFWNEAKGAHDDGR